MKILVLSFFLALALLGCASSDVEGEAEPNININDVSTGDLPPLPPAENLESSDPVTKTAPVVTEPIAKKKPKKIAKKPKKLKKKKKAKKPAAPKAEVQPE